MSVKKIHVPGFCWDEKGGIESMPPDTVCCVYHYKERDRKSVV